MNKKNLFDNISNDYVMDYTIFDTITYTSVTSGKKQRVRQALKNIIEFLLRK